MFILNITRIYIFFATSFGLYHHHVPVIELGHLLTRSGLTYPEVSSKVYHDSFCQLGISVSLLTYLLIPWCRVLLEKLTGLQLVKKFPAFHWTRRFITALTSVRQLSLSWASTIQSIYPHPTSWRSILILSTHLSLGLLSGLFPSGYPPKPSTPRSPHPYAPHAQPISFFSILSPAQYWVNCTSHLAPRYATTHESFLQNLQT